MTIYVNGMDLKCNCPSFVRREMRAKMSQVSVVGRGRGWGCLTQACILTLPYNPPLPISTPKSLQSSQMGTNFSGGNGVFDSYNDKTNNFEVI